MTIAVSTLLLVAFIVLGNTVQVPYVALGPGPTVNTLDRLPADEAAGDGEAGKPVVDITGADLDEVSGHLNLTTVAVTDGLTLFGAMAMWLSGDEAVQPRERYYPEGRSNEQVREENQQLMTDSGGAATAAALRYLDRPTKLVAASVAANGPAAAELRPGDEISSIDGVAVSDSTELLEAVRGLRPQQSVELEIARDGQPSRVQVTLGARPDEEDVAYLGVTPTVLNADPDLEINYNVGAIGGPSAGLMLTLAIVDLLSPGELTNGDFIAGTGTIDDGGNVGPIGGITHKTKAARDAGASVFLVPADNCAEASSDIPDGLRLVRVENLDDAIDSLAAIGDGRDAPTCSR